MVYYDDYIKFVCIDNGIRTFCLFVPSLCLVVVLILICFESVSGNFCLFSLCIFVV